MRDIFAFYLILYKLSRGNNSGRINFYTFFYILGGKVLLEITWR